MTKTAHAAGLEVLLVRLDHASREWKPHIVSNHELKLIEKY